MKNVLRFANFAALGLCLSPIAAVDASPLPLDSLHFCVPFDYEEWRQDNPRPAAKRLSDLNVGEPRTVRMIYFLPSDRPFRPSVVQKMKDEILNIQAFFSAQMQAHVLRRQNPSLRDRRPGRAAGSPCGWETP